MFFTEKINILVKAVLAYVVQRLKNFLVSKCFEVTQSDTLLFVKT